MSGFTWLIPYLTELSVAKKHSDTWVHNITIQIKQFLLYLNVLLNENELE